MLSRLLLVLAVSLTLFSGCLGGKGEDTDGTASPSPMPPPAPKEIYQKELSTCSAPAAVEASETKKIEVEDGYDELVISFHTSGVGRIQASIRPFDSNAKIWEKADDRTTPQAQTTCGGHSHEGSGDTRPAEPGEYEVKLVWQGTVAAHFDVTERSSRSTDNATHHEP